MIRRCATIRGLATAVAACLLAVGCASTPGDAAKASAALRAALANSAAPRASAADPKATLRVRAEIETDGDDSARPYELTLSYPDVWSVETLDEDGVPVRYRVLGGDRVREEAGVIVARGVDAAEAGAVDLLRSLFVVQWFAARHDGAVRLLERDDEGDPLRLSTTDEDGREWTLELDPVTRRPRSLRGFRALANGGAVPCEVEYLEFSRDETHREFPSRLRTRTPDGASVITRVLDLSIETGASSRARS